MPDMTVTYRCSFCGRVFRDEEQAALCEQHHLKPNRIVPGEECYTQKGYNQYPKSIVVEFPDQQQIRYFM